MIEAPNLDRLAANGLCITQCYSCSVCEPARAAFLTGLHPRFTRRMGQAVMLKDDMVTLAEVLRDAGYATAMSGKWHLSANPLDRGFDEHFGH